ncbi:MAG TPA: hypothetical protein VKW09_03370 [bacterium]|nr:hypothetical protein [bacterium]
MLAVLVVVLSGPAAVDAGSNGTLNIAITSGHPIVVDVITPSVTLPANDGTGGCVAILVRTSIRGWSLGASYSTSPSAQLDLALQPATGTACAIATNAGTTPALNLDRNGTTTLLSDQKDSERVAYALVVGSRPPLTSPVTVTLTFTVDAPGAPVAQAVVTIGLDGHGRVTAMRP